MRYPLLIHVLQIEGIVPSPVHILCLIIAQAPVNMIVGFMDKLMENPPTVSLAIASSPFYVSKIPTYIPLLMASPFYCKQVDYYDSIVKKTFLAFLERGRIDPLFPLPFLYIVSEDLTFVFNAECG